MNHIHSLIKFFNINNMIESYYEFTMYVVISSSTLKLQK